MRTHVTDKLMTGDMTLRFVQRMLKIGADSLPCSFFSSNAQQRLQAYIPDSIE
jgi:hypothetical protein